MRHAFSPIRIPHSAFRIFAILFIFSSLAPAAPYDLIICGQGGEKEYEDRFAEWGARLQKVLTQKLDHPSQNVTLFAEAKTASRLPDALASNLETITATLQKLAAACKSDDVLFIYLVGHGSFQNGESKFNIDGPDLSATDLKSLLANLPARDVAVINAASSSAGFINALSLPGRVICTATRSTDERNATDFMEYFLQAIEDQSADQNRDSRISVLEACQQAAALTQAGYTGKGMILTEHALLDDDGDALGSRLPLDKSAAGQNAPGKPAASKPAGPGDGPRAAAIYLKDFIFPPSVPPDLIAKYRAALAGIDELKSRKATLATADYTAQLETLLLKAARLNREIHSRLSNH